MTEPFYILRGEEYIQVGTLDSAIIGQPAPDPDPPSVGTDEELRAAIEAWEPGNLPIYARTGTYSPIDVPEGKSGIEILAAPGHEPFCSGLVPFRAAWTTQGHLVAAPYAGFPGRSWHWSKSSSAGDAHRRSACPDLFAIRDGDLYDPLRLVHDQADLMPGSYMIVTSGSDVSRPTHVIIYLPDGFDTDDVYHAPTPYLFRADGCDGVRFKGWGLGWCGNTHKAGAVQVTGQGWDVDVAVNTAMVGISVRGTGHNLNASRADGCFQLGFLLDGCHMSTFPDCSASDNNTRGANARHEAGGLKGVNSTANTFGRFTAAGNLGPGHWMDISCHRTRLLSYRGRGNAAACVQIEHYMDDGEYADLECIGTRPYWLEADRSDELGLVGPAGLEKIGSLWIQSNIQRLRINGARFDNTPLAVKIKEHERRGVTRDCIFDGFQYGPGVVQRKSAERFTTGQILTAIAGGAQPATVAEWQAVRNVYGEEAGWSA